MARALLANGWEVSEPIVDEIYDLVAVRPENKEFVTVQVKTIRRRTDRQNELVVYATNGKGEPYQQEDCDYIAGVEGDDVYLIPCVGNKEYWSRDGEEKTRWIHLKAK